MPVQQSTTKRKENQRFIGALSGQHLAEKKGNSKQREPSKDTPEEADMIQRPNSA